MAWTATAAYKTYQAAYADEPFVHLLPEGRWPTTSATLGGNAVHLQVTVDADAGRLVVVSAVDNLTKGTAGAAIQSMNLALGFAGDDRPDHRRSRAVKVTTLPAGFRIDTGTLLVNEGPTDTAAGMFTATTARRAVVPPGPHRRPAARRRDHAAGRAVPSRSRPCTPPPSAPRADLDIGAVEVAVCWAASSLGTPARLTADGWAVGGVGSTGLRAAGPPTPCCPPPHWTPRSPARGADGYFVLLLASGAVGQRGRTSPSSPRRCRRAAHRPGVPPQGGAA